MARDSTLDHLVDRACREWERRREAATAAVPAAPPRPFTVALAREAGAGASAVAEEVGRRLGWTVYDRDLVERIAEEMGLRASLVESVDERHTSWLTESVKQFVKANAAVPAVSESAYVRHLVETVLALGAHGECVVVGRGSVLILPPETTLRVRLVASLKDRAARVARRLNLDPEAAAGRIRQLDRERDRFVRDHFLKDPNDPRNIDLILNTSRFSIGACADLITDALRQLTGVPAGLASAGS
jgi:cytidylate kinase